MQRLFGRGLRVTKNNVTVLYLCVEVRFITLSVPREDEIILILKGGKY